MYKKITLDLHQKDKPYCTIHVTTVHNFHINNSNKKFLPFSSLSEDLRIKSKQCQFLLLMCGAKTTLL